MTKKSYPENIQFLCHHHRIVRLCALQRHCLDRRHKLPVPGYQARKLAQPNPHSNPGRQNLDVPRFHGLGQNGTAHRRKLLPGSMGSSSGPSLAHLQPILRMKRTDERTETRTERHAYGDAMTHFKWDLPPLPPLFVSFPSFLSIYSSLTHSKRDIRLILKVTIFLLFFWTFMSFGNEEI